MNDPGDECAERDREAIEAESKARSGTLHDLAKKCDTDSLRDQAIESLEGVVKANEPPPPPNFRW